MLRRPKHPAITSLRLYVLGAIFLIPLSLGIVLVTNSASASEHAYQISHDVGSMYAQGVDFSQNANQSIALSVAIPAIGSRMPSMVLAHCSVSVRYASVLGSSRTSSVVSAMVY